mmetsp:Transcript_59194/g.137857  ORF Transcript_59194/g.137857 Transcript_59194/m.137857 type:complete len:220 (+) Transcript_59194:903-1562(+)
MEVETPHGHHELAERDSAVTLRVEAMSPRHQQRPKATPEHQSEVIHAAHSCAILAVLVGCPRLEGSLLGDQLLAPPLHGPLDWVEQHLQRHGCLLLGEIREKLRACPCHDAVQVCSDPLPPCVGVKLLECHAPAVAATLQHPEELLGIQGQPQTEATVPEALLVDAAAPFWINPLAPRGEHVAVLVHERQLEAPNVTPDLGVELIDGDEAVAVQIELGP